MWAIGFVAGDTILVATGVYSGSGEQVVVLDRDAILSGGWDAGFGTQSGTSTIDGQGARRGITVSFATAVVERFAIENGYAGDNYGGGIRNGGTFSSNKARISGGGLCNGSVVAVAGEYAYVVDGGNL